MNKTTNQYINQLNLDPKREAAVRKLVEGAGGVSDSTPLVESLIGNELIPIKQDGENKAVSVEQIKNNVLAIPSNYEFVDLGLPSGTKWATTNIGAVNPEDAGLYFAWGETEGYTAEDVTAGKKAFSWNDYKFGTQNNLTKYNATDGLTQLELIDDAAYQSDNTCRMPTKDELQELVDNTTSNWETLNGVNGRRFTSTNGNSIFVPAAGAYSDGQNSQVDLQLCLSSSSLGRTIKTHSTLTSYSDSIDTDTFLRRSGYSIRPVQPANTPTTINLKELQSKVNNIEIQAKDAKELFIVTYDMFEQTATTGAPSPVLTFTDEGWSNFREAAATNKIIALDYKVAGALLPYATPLAISRNDNGYFILTGLNYDSTSFSISASLTFTSQAYDSPAVYMLSFDDKYVYSQVINTPSEVYQLNIDNYSTAEDFNNLKEAIQNNNIIQLTSSYGHEVVTIANYDEESNMIVISVTILVPAPPSYKDVGIQPFQYLLRPDGTKTILNQAVVTLNTAGDGTKFLADDGSYKTIDIASILSRLDALEGK